MRFEGSFGKWLRQRRKALDLTQQDLADQVSYSVVTLRKIERDLSRPSKQMAEQLADVLAVAPDERLAFMNFARRVTDTPPALPVDLSSLTPAHNLPAQSTVFIGREAEQAQIASLLSDPTCRLLTLIGPGGIGKTRLALQAASEQNADYADGVFFVPLAPVCLSTLIEAAIANVLHISFSGQEAPNVQIINYLRNKHLLLVMDNYEHLLPEIGLLTDLLATSPGLKIVVTSRERLNIQGEWTLLVEGLPFPDNTSHSSTEMESYSAVQLFVQRARQVQADFPLEDHIQEVGEICRAVEGMPLGIELAASWLRAMTCQQIARQIKHDLDFLVTPLRDVPARHRSLRLVFEHSWTLLSPSERSVLMKLSVFRGGITPEAAEHVAGASLLLLASLVDKSLVRLNAAGRYELHEILRQFAAYKLIEAGVTAETRQSHFQFFLSMAEQLDQWYFGPYHIAGMDALEAELDNFRAALEWSSQTGNAEACMRLASALGWFWNRRTYRYEGLGWLQKFPFDRADIPLAIRARVIHHTLEMYFELGVRTIPAALLTEALRLAHEIDDRRLAGWLLTSIGFVTGDSEYERSITFKEDALRIFRELGDHWGICEVLGRLSGAMIQKGDFTRAREYQLEAIQLARQANDKSILAYLLWLAGNRNWYSGKVNRQTENFYHESLKLFTELRDRNGMMMAMNDLGRTFYHQGDNDEAQLCFEASLRLALTMHDDRIYKALSLAGLANILTKAGQAERAASVFGAITDVIQACFAGELLMNVRDRMDFEAGLAAARAALDAETFETAFAEGQRMSLQEIVPYALNEIPTSNPTI